MFLMGLKMEAVPKKWLDRDARNRFTAAIVLIMALGCILILPRFALYAAPVEGSVIPFQYYQRLIFLTLKVNDSDSLLFLFDTGANVSALDEQTARQLNLFVSGNDTVEGTAGVKISQSVRIASVEIGGKKVTDLKWTVNDLSAMLTPGTRRLDGIVGMDVFKTLIVEVDFKGERMTVLKEARAQGRYSIPFEWDNGIPRVRATINDSVQTFLRYDSGASLFDTEDVYINVTTPVWKQLQKIDPALKPKFALSGSGGGGTVTLDVARVRKITLGGKEIDSPYIIVQPPVGYFARSDAVGFIGNYVLEKYGSIILDFVNKMIRL